MALAAFDSLARWLGQGIADVTSLLDPGCFVIGGESVKQAICCWVRPAGRSCQRCQVGRIDPFPKSVSRNSEIAPGLSAQPTSRATNPAATARATR